MLFSILSGFIVSVILIMVILFTNEQHMKFSHDNDLKAIQKYHTQPTPRVGGIAVFLSLVAVTIINKLLNFKVNYDVSIIVSVGLVFIIGIIEDISKKVSPLIRMVALTLSVFVAIYITHAMPAISYSDFGYLDYLIQKYSIIGIALSWFCVVGLTNAYNIIDGYNGLSATTAILNLIGLATLAFYVHDVNIIQVALILSAIIVGFLIFNYPLGKIFLGDGGAYSIGFIIAILSIYLIHVHKGVVSPYAVLLMSIYPVTEMGFSMYRRKFIHRTHGMQPDNMHLHQLVYHQCVPIKVKNPNAYVMPLMLFFMIPPIVCAVLFYKSTAICLSIIVLYIVLYVHIYFRLTHFKTPKFLKILL